MENVYQAIKNGRVYVAHEYWQSAKGFSFSIGDDENEVCIGGEFILKNKPAFIKVNIPAKGLIRIICNGEKIYETPATGCTLEIKEKGVYRIEAYQKIFGKYRPWIYSNHINVSQTMKILDPNRLIPDHDLLICLITTHPFDASLKDKISKIIIRLSEIRLSENCEIPQENIEVDIDKGEVYLGVGRSTHKKEDYNSILYHEFGHVADKMNVNFRYSEDLKSKLSKSEQICVMELWNAYINSRLNDVGLYIASGVECCGTLNGKEEVFPGTIEGDLKVHRAILEREGVSCKFAKELIEDIWKHPNEPLTYPMMVTKIKTGLANKPI